MKNFITLALLSLLLALTATAQAQTPSDYFQVFTKPAYPHGNGRFSLNRDSLLTRIVNAPDTVSTLATFVVSVDNAANIDSLYFTLTNSLGQSIYSGALQYASLSGSGSLKVLGNTVYVTVGPYAYLKHFSATAQVKNTDGTTSSIRSFSKN